MNFDTYLSPFSWRYGSPEMRSVWSETHKRLLWRSVWVALAEAQSEYGLVTQAQLEDIRAHQDQIDIQRALDIEASIHHDLMAELKTYAQQCPLGGGILHLGATSTDIEDNADVLRLRDGLTILLEKLANLLITLSDQIEKWSAVPCIAYTHLQPAEPTTIGYRLAGYAQDLLRDYSRLQQQKDDLRGKGFKGAVGTAASYCELIGMENYEKFEASLSEKLGLPFFYISTQTYPRQQDYEVISSLAAIGITLYKFSFDLRVLQSPAFGEWSEPFGQFQVGSSAMPFKRNPIQSEKIDSLARLLSQMPATAWNNAALSLLERTLDDSANRRSLLPESFLISDEILQTAARLVANLNIHSAAVQSNFSRYASFAATERVLLALVKAGADRQMFHEKIRLHSLTAWEQIQRQDQNPLLQLMLQDSDFTAYLTPTLLSELMNVETHIGVAAQRALDYAKQIRIEVNSLKSN